MKRTIFFLTAVLTALISGVFSTSQLSVRAASSATPVESSLSQSGELIAGRYQFRLRVRPARYRIGGFRRGNTCFNAGQVMAMVPPTRDAEQVGFREVAVDSTLSERPTFLIYVTGLGDKEAQFTLQNAEGTEEIYSTTFTLPEESGVVAVEVPSTASALEVGESYLWQVAVICNASDRSEDAVVGSWVERNSLETLQESLNEADATDAELSQAFDSLAQRLSAANDREKPLVLAELGVWQDSIAELAEMRYRNPRDRDLIESWMTLLQSVDMDVFGTAEVVQLER
ncbi:MAG: DUF928 domain-containing protein [Leptolyngbyaceae cyanobacterium SM1_1_3]|nr:DUF928 domain-containing protein [Leptolyngbyaceae cyanobacterium SM1_1_3]NJN02257.1 DUF928 domain-containing protein [Leptolyngbyaceae cyanobacterium RM1_1_2]NJO08461.1 DUF928 domain-containing protein [Leptolyngbyaceae cyanobacterium SL_1_1]